jgi:hypothetical protein
MSDDKRGAPLYIDVKRFLANKAGAEAVGIAMDLIGLVWWPTKTAFVFDEEVLAAQLAALLPARGYTANMLRKRRKAVATFFTALPDGRWVPSPKFFSLTDGNAEHLARLDEHGGD